MNAKLVRSVGVSIALSLAVYLLLLPTLLWISAVPRQQLDPSVGEPNNTFGSASPIVVDASIEETIAPSGDVDWYTLTVDQQGELQVSITGVAAELALQVRVWNGNKSTVSNWFAPLAAGGETMASIDLAQAGRYYLEVADGVGNAESAQPYTLHTLFTPTADLAEPNNSFGSATPLALAQLYSANILPAGDVDWYSLEVVEHGELSLHIGDVADDLAVSVRLWNNNKETLSNWISPLSQGGDTNGVVDLPVAGRYLLEVAGNSGERSTQPYVLEATFVAAVDALEPNNSFGTAAPITLGESVAANMLPQGDADWYRVQVDHHGELSVAVTDVPETLAIQVLVWNSNKETVSDWIAPLAAGGETHGTIDLPSAGTYYFEFVDANNKRSTQPFSVNVSFLSAADPYEDNNSFGSASHLSLGHVVQSNILPRNDSDWHRIELSHQGELQITASDVPDSLDVNFRVWNSNQETISQWFAPLARGGNTVGLIDIPAAGVYYVEVADGGGDARSIEPFALEAHFVPAADQGEPNETIEAATPAVLDSTIAANILPTNDADWYRLEIGESGDLHVLITNVAPTLQLVFRLWNEQEQVVFDWVYPLAAGGNTEGIFTIAEAGIYYLQVGDNRSARSIQPYLLRVSMEEIDPAGMTFTQTLIDTQLQTDTVRAVEEGTEVMTVTTTIVTTTTTIEASGAVSESAVVTETEVLTDTSVITRTVGSSTPAAPTPSSGGGKMPAPSSTTITSTTSLTPTTEMTETAEITETVEITSVSVITPTSEITTTSPMSATGSLPPPVTPPTTNLPSAISSTAAVIPDGETITVEGVAIVLPSGWQVAAESGPFRGLALNPDDLTTAIPQGPRLWVLTPGVADLEFTGMVEPMGDDLAIVEAATTFQIGERTAIAIGVEERFGEQTLIRRYVYIYAEDGEAYQFILEAPADQWDEQVSLLEGILASVLIEPS